MTTRSVPPQDENHTHTHTFAGGRANIVRREAEVKSPLKQQSHEPSAQKPRARLEE